MNGFIHSAEPKTINHGKHGITRKKSIECSFYVFSVSFRVFRGYKAFDLDVIPQEAPGQARGDGAGGLQIVEICNAHI